MTKAIFWTCLATSVILIVVGFCLPPQGVVDGSVLASVGELFAFAALATGYQALKDGRDITVKHGETEFTIGDGNNE